MKKTIAKNIEVQGDLTTVGYNAEVVYTPVEGQHLGRQIYPVFNNSYPLELRDSFLTDHGRRVVRSEMISTLCLVEYEEEYDEFDEAEAKLDKKYERMETKLMKKQKIPSAWLQ